MNTLKRIKSQGLLLLYRLWMGRVLKLLKAPDYKTERNPENLYYSVKGLPFDKFLDFYVDGDYSALIKYKRPVPGKIKAWYYKRIKRTILSDGTDDILNLVLAGEQVLNDFTDHSAGVEDLNKIRHIVRVQQLQYKVDRIQAIVDSLSISYNEGLVEALREHGIPLLVREASLQEDLKRVVSFSKKYVVELETIQRKYENDKEPEKPTREAFEAILALIDPKLMANMIDGLRFCVLYKQLKERSKVKDRSKWQMNG